MSEQLTVELNRKEYALSEEFRERIENRAEAEFEENHFLDYYWSENERGDPILNIETEGCWVPWDRLERLEFEMAPTEEQPDSDGEGDDSDDETENLDNGNGVKSVPKDDVDMDAPPTAQPSDDEEAEEPDTSFMLTHPSKHYIPQPEEDDPEKLPPDPEEIPEDPSLVYWVPDDGRTEVWSTGKALIPTNLFLQWNIQVKADEAPDDAVKEVPNDDGGIEQVPRTNSHDSFEWLAEETDCEVVAKRQPSDTPSQPEGDDSEQSGEYQGRKPDETLDGKYGGNNWNI